MGILITLILGAFVGWVASIVTKRDAEQGWIGNIIVGVVGSFLAVLIFNEGRLVFDLSSLFVAFIGAVVLCAGLNLLQKGRVR